MANEILKVLLIEDEESLAEVLKTKLVKEGYEVFVAYDGENGFNKISEIKPDIILLDILMPKLNGYEVLEKLKQNKIEIPVIVISNSGQPVELEKTKQLGAVDYLIKANFDPSEVIDKINKYLGRTTDIKSENINTEIKPLEPENKISSLGIKVLLVEDEFFLREICGKKLASEGFTVFEAVDGEKAVEMVTKVKPDIVLLDIILPAMDGFEVLKKIREDKDEKIKKIPVIMLSNLGQDDDIKKAMDLGADNYLVKAHFATDEIGKIILKHSKKEV